MKKLLLKAIFILAAAATLAVGSTNAYFTDSDATSSDTFTANWHVAKARMVINEVYYLGDDEWIELYNASDAAADIKGWTICDSDKNCGSLNPAKKTTVAPGAYVLVSHDSANLKDWHVAKEIVDINYAGGKINFNDTGDAIILENTEKTVIDQMSYGTETSVFATACPTVGIGHSLQRNPAGLDTDTEADFTDQQAPSVGY
jgi:predicted ribosomally synthesized peptide with SipW-like signal peptide